MVAQSSLSDAGISKMIDDRSQQKILEDFAKIVIGIEPIVPNEILAKALQEYFGSSWPDGEK